MTQTHRLAAGGYRVQRCLRVKKKKLPDDTFGVEVKVYTVYTFDDPQTLQSCWKPARKLSAVLEGVYKSVFSFIYFSFLPIRYIRNKKLKVLIMKNGLVENHGKMKMMTEWNNEKIPNWIYEDFLK